MNSLFKKFSPHALPLLLVLGMGAALNIVPHMLSGISPAYRQSSDATVHVVQWREFAPDYRGEFANDLMFQNYQGQPTGTLLVDRVLVAIASVLRIPVLDASIVVSVLSLALFLSGVYALSFSILERRLLATIIALASIIPVISLGLSSWGFLALGFVPKETSLGIAVWLSLLYVRGVKTENHRTLTLFFFLLGLASNWYPVLFFHYALVVLAAEVLRKRAIQKWHFIYGILFLAAAPIALYDIFGKASDFSAPAVDIVIDHYSGVLHSIAYLSVHYLRKQILYTGVLGLLWYGYHRVVRRPVSETIRAWLAIWFASLLISLFGVGIELWFPAYMKYLVTRVSIWFYFSSMVLIAYFAASLYATRFKSRSAHAVLAALLLIFFLAQSSLPHTLDTFKQYVSGAPDYQAYLSVATKLHSIVPASALVLANPDQEAKTLRAYGDVGTFVSAKDGNVTLFDGNAARLWNARYREVQSIFKTKDFLQIKAYATQAGLHYYFYDTRDIESGTTELVKDTVITSGPYGLAQF